MADALQPSTPPLTPEALALIKAGTPTPQKPNPLLSPAAVFTAPPKVTEVVVEKPAVESKPSGKAKSPKETAPAAATLVSVTLRLPAEIPTALLKASSERKLKRLHPYTQQDIAGEALTEWLKKQGYLG